MVVLLEGSPIYTEELWSSVSILFLVTYLTKALFPRLFSLAMLQKCFGTDLCLDTILTQTSMDNSFDRMAWILHCQLWDLIETGVCLSKSCPIN